MNWFQKAKFDVFPSIKMILKSTVIDWCMIAWKKWRFYELKIMQNNCSPFFRVLVWYTANDWIDRSVSAFWIEVIFIKEEIQIQY